MGFCTVTFGVMLLLWYSSEFTTGNYEGTTGLSHQTLCTRTGSGSHENFETASKVCIRPGTGLRLTYFVNVNETDCGKTSVDCTVGESFHFTLLSLTANKKSVCCTGNKSYLESAVCEARAAADECGWIRLPVQRYDTLGSFKLCAPRRFNWWMRYEVQCFPIFRSTQSSNRYFIIVIATLICIATVYFVSHRAQMKGKKVSPVVAV